MQVHIYTIQFTLDLELALPRSFRADSPVLV